MLKQMWSHGSHGESMQNSTTRYISQSCSESNTRGGRAFLKHTIIIYDNKIYSMPMTIKICPNIIINAVML